MRAPTGFGLIGFGAIGRAIALYCGQAGAARRQLVAACVREEQVEAARSLLPSGALVTTRLDDLLECSPELVIEAAGQSAIRDHGERIVSCGLELWVLSVGALADPQLSDRIIGRAREQGARIGIPAGALGGFDGLMALRLGGLTSVTYTSTKPPHAWRGTVAQESHCLNRLARRTTLFAGSAREAALRFPKNANLAAAVALAGVGFDATAVELVADPEVIGNVGRVQAAGELGSLDVILSGRASRENPKTSEITAMSVLSALDNRSAVMAFV